ncbi:unnamed protein product [Ilex paraguariensis]|uniref:MADS-box domain-containing protein n=1 Tax=Ilex paraguariensis TaxID=185542 RepID=A0ABC8USV1_9AQUA
MARKMNQRRGKIQLKMIPQKGARQVTFSKRKASLFKKANELCTLTGAQVAIIVFSPGGKPFSFGHPSVDTITNRFLNQWPMSVPGYQNPVVAELNQRYNNLCQQIEAEKRRGEMLQQMEMERQKHCWLGRPMEELNLRQLMISKKLMEDLRGKLVERVKELSVQQFCAMPSSANPVRFIDLNVADPAETESSFYPFMD